MDYAQERDAGGDGWVIPAAGRQPLGIGCLPDLWLHIDIPLNSPETPASVSTAMEACDQNARENHFVSNALPLQPPLGPRGVRIAGTVIGASAFCIYSHTWQDGWHVLYDISASVAVFSFLAQILAEGLARNLTHWWWRRVVAAAAMTVITLGREFLGWPVSGHVTTVIAIAIIQSQEGRLSRPLRLAYWVPLPILIVTRWLHFDGGLASSLYLALLAGGMIGGGAIVCKR